MRKNPRTTGYGRKNGLRRAVGYLLALIMLISSAFPVYGAELERSRGTDVNVVVTSLGGVIDCDLTVQKTTPSGVLLLQFSKLVHPLVDDAAWTEDGGAGLPGGVSIYPVENYNPYQPGGPGERWVMEDAIVIHNMSDTEKNEGRAIDWKILTEGYEEWGYYVLTINPMNIGGVDIAFPPLYFRAPGTGIPPAPPMSDAPELLAVTPGDQALTPYWTVPELYDQESRLVSYTLGISTGGVEYTLTVPVEKAETVTDGAIASGVSGSAVVRYGLSQTLKVIKTSDGTPVTLPLKNGTAYEISVRADTDSGGVSAWSNTITKMPAGAPVNPPSSLFDLKPTACGIIVGPGADFTTAGGAGSGGAGGGTGGAPWPGYDPAAGSGDDYSGCPDGYYPGIYPYEIYYDVIVSGGGLTTPAITTLTPGAFFPGAGPVVIPGLDNGVEYEVTIVVRSEAGESQTPWTGQEIPADVPDAPLVSGGAVASESVSIELSSPSGNGRPVTGYAITVATGSGVYVSGGAFYQSDGSPAETTVIYVNQADMSSSGGIYTHIIDGLAADTEYTVFVQAVNEMGKSPYSTPVAVTTERGGEAPSAPLIIQAEPGGWPTGEAIMITWGGIESDGPLTEIVVRVTWPAIDGTVKEAYLTYGAADVENGVLSGSLTAGSVEMKGIPGLDIENGTEYFVSVGARNDTNPAEHSHDADDPEGPDHPYDNIAFGRPVSVIPAGQPETPDKPELSSTSEPALIITWPEADGNGRLVEEYEITVTDPQNPDASHTITLKTEDAKPGPNPDEFFTYTVENEVTKYAVNIDRNNGFDDNGQAGWLENGKTYEVMVKAKTEIGTSEASSASDRETIRANRPEAPKPPAIGEEVESLRVTFVKPYDRGETITEYTFRMTPENGKPYYVTVPAVALGNGAGASAAAGASLSHIITGLTPGIRYQIEVGARNSLNPVDGPGGPWDNVLFSLPASGVPKAQSSGGNNGSGGGGGSGKPAEDPYLEHLKEVVPGVEDGEVMFRTQDQAMSEGDESIISKDRIQQVIDSNTSLVVAVYEDESWDDLLYVWVFDPKRLDADKLEDFKYGIDFLTTIDRPVVDDTGTVRENVLRFRCQGELPGEMLLKIKNIWNYDKDRDLYIYDFDGDTQKLLLRIKNIRVDRTGFISLKLNGTFGFVRELFDLNGQEKDPAQWNGDPAAGQTGEETNSSAGDAGTQVQGAAGTKGTRGKNGSQGSADQGAGAAGDTSPSAIGAAGDGDSGSSGGPDGSGEKVVEVSGLAGGQTWHNFAGSGPIGQLYYRLLGLLEDYPAAGATILLGLMLFAGIGMIRRVKWRPQILQKLMP